MADQFGRDLPYLPERRIERDAEALLASFAEARQVVVKPPIPIEDIVEKHLRLGIEFDDMHERLRVPRPGVSSDPDILGAIFFEDARVAIDESLDPEENPAKEGRYRFTLAHETGHWRLHRELFAKNLAQGRLFAGPVLPSLVCRSSEAKKPIERQADSYAACLLMPRPLVLEAWNQMFPDGRRRVVQPDAPIDHPYIGVPRFGAVIGAHRWVETDDQVLDRVARPLAEVFMVSPIAMRIRLEKLGLLLREIPEQQLLPCFR